MTTGVISTDHREGVGHDDRCYQYRPQKRGWDMTTGVVSTDHRKGGGT